MGNKENKNNHEQPTKSKKTTILKIRIPRSKIKKNKKNIRIKSQSKAYYLTPILADKIAEKMQKWLDNFIKNGFMDKEYLQYVHHYKRYKKNETKNTQHNFNNLDMKFDKIKIAENGMAEDLNNNPEFDWNDDSSFYYKAKKEIQQKNGNLIPVEIDEIVNGKPYKDTFLWDQENGLDLNEFVLSLCNDLKQKDDDLRDRILKSAKKQIAECLKVRNEYKASLEVFGNKIDKRSNNYLQHLKKKGLSVSDNMNLMNNISDILHGHILIKLEITHGKIRLIDEFLWNLNDSENDHFANIEQFANTLCADQGLPFIFAPSIAFSIRKQINSHKMRMTKSMKEGGNNLNTINDPLLHESLRYVGRKRERDLKNLKMWEPTILVHKPPNRMKTTFRDQQ